MSCYIVNELGTVVEFTTAAFIQWTSGKDYVAIIYESKNDKGECQGFVARVPKGSIVTFHRPGTIRQAGDARHKSLVDSLNLVTECVQSITGWQNLERVRELKSKLSNFDARSKCWK